MRTLILLVVVLAGCDSGAKQPRPGPTRPQPSAEVPGTAPAASTPVPAPAPGAVAADSGEALYGTLCAKCHGPEGKGYAADNAPSLVTKEFLESATDHFIARSIAAGRPGSSMGAYSTQMGGPLDDVAIGKVVTWIRSKGPASVALAPAGPGDAARGAKLYGQYCNTCHGDTTTRADFIHLANVRFLEIASDAFIRHGVVHGRTGTKMLAFGTVMQPQQIDDVVAYVRTFASGAAAEALLPAPTGKEPLVLNPKGRDPGFQAREGRFVPVDAVAKALKAKQKLVIIDARPPSDWRRAHIAGAVSIPYHDLKRLEEVPPDATVIAYCACPHHLSGDVVDALIKRGHTKAYVLDEGINDWHRKGYPITAAAGVLPPPAETHSHAGHGH